MCIAKRNVGFVWNEREHSHEEHELVYEISWIKELGLWRTFLWSRHKVNG